MTLVSSGTARRPGPMDHLKTPSLTCLLADAGCQLKPRLGCLLEHQHRSSLYCLGFLATCGWILRASFSRKNEPDGGHFTFYANVSEVLQCHFHCFYPGEGIDSIS